MVNIKHSKKSLSTIRRNYSLRFRPATRPDFAPHRPAPGTLARTELLEAASRHRRLHGGGLKGQQAEDQVVAEAGADLPTLQGQSSV
jgi:hypothetical protein